MKTERLCTADEARFELRYRGLFDPGHGFALPCDATGRVELDRLSERARVNYLCARATVGFDLAAPIVLVVQ
jgi:hypothetical protein